MSNTNIRRINSQDNYGNHFHSCGVVDSVVTSQPIYTPPSGHRFVITDILVSVNNDNLITITEDGNGQCANIWRLIANTQARTGLNFSHSFNTPYFSRNPNNPILITTTTTEPVYYSITGYFIKD